MRWRVIWEKKFSTVVVEHRVDELAGRGFALDGIEEADELAVAVALHAAADHGSVEHAEGGEQGGRAMALIVVRHGLATPGLDRQPGLGAVERLDLAFLVEREHHGMRRGIDIEADDVAELGRKTGSRERLKVRRRCGCRWCPRQMRCTEPSESPIALAIARPVQWVA